MRFMFPLARRQGRLVMLAGVCALLFITGQAKAERNATWHTVGLLPQAELDMYVKRPSAFDTAQRDPASLPVLQVTPTEREKPARTARTSTRPVSAQPRAATHAASLPPTTRNPSPSTPLATSTIPIAGSEHIAPKQPALKQPTAPRPPIHSTSAIAPKQPVTSTVPAPYSDNAATVGELPNTNAAQPDIGPVPNATPLPRASIPINAPDPKP